MQFRTCVAFGFPSYFVECLAVSRCTNRIHYLLRFELPETQHSELSNPPTILVVGFPDHVLPYCLGRFLPSAIRCRGRVGQCSLDQLGAEYRIPALAIIFPLN